MQSSFHRLRVILVAGSAFVPSLLISQVPAPVTLTRTHSAIKLDGHPDEAAWQDAAPFSLRMYTPTAGNPTGDSSVVRLAYDDQYLYAAGWFFTPEANTIRPGLFGRDQLGAEDHFMLILDAADDNQTGYVFTTVPSGAKTDFAIGADGQTLDKNWNGYWDGVSSRDDKGWYTEVRIPLSTLRFQRVNGLATMGLIIHRYSAARSEMDTYPSLDPSFAGALFRPSIAGKIVLENVEARSPLYVTPYVLGGMNSLAKLPSGANNYVRNQQVTHEAGVDAKFGITSSLVADLTVNTDFAQVEADNQQVNLTRFSLFFPEKRQFFLERSDLFAVNAGNGDLLFHSRRIGIGDSGQPLRIYGGARAVGRIGSWDVGALSMQTDVSTGSGSENDGAFRLRHPVINSGSYVGGFVTTRFAPGGEHNVVTAADAVLKPFGNDFVTLQAARSIDSRDSVGIDPAMGRLSWERRANGGLQYSAEYRRIGRDFDPGLGFQSRNGISESSAAVGYGWLPGVKTIFSSITPYVFNRVVNRNQGPTLDMRLLHGSLDVKIKSGRSGFISASRQFERLNSDFRIGAKATVPRGDYTSTWYGIGVFSSSKSRFSGSVTAAGGDIYDGSRAILTFGPRWNASEHLQVASDWSFTRLHFPSRNEYVNGDLARLKVQYALDSHVSVASFVQYNRAARAAAANVRFRWQFAEGHDLWLVYNDLLNTKRDPFSPDKPELPLSTSRTFLVKYSHVLVR